MLSRGLKIFPNSSINSVHIPNIDGMPKAPAHPQKAEYTRRTNKKKVFAMQNVCPRVKNS